ncbi:MAG TPA: tRNA (adenosine(37)-N6)-threonylcarbamoyltransferase complex dimerization subunit type 1 TsaB [Aliiroseovarius sp.]|nr:tRNA (adenosine(37)-N6)-threonylcarbamoyltransferase complex dimerization subunit type 1 TsaB [Aliiroseovarius sp.]
MAADPIILAFDTSRAWCAACLHVGDQPPVTRVDPMARGQAEHLMVMLADMLNAAGLGWRDVDVIGVGTGPGNFTGIRISVAAARGLAMSLNIAAIGVTGFEAVAGQTRPCWVALSAPRDQAYLQHLTDDTGGSAAQLVPATQLDQLDAPVIRDDDVTPERQIETIAALAMQRRHQTASRPAPFYVRAADAAPPRDPAPVILP